MAIDKNTKICISIAEKPGTFGVTFHNKGYTELNLNYLYLPLKIHPSQLKTILEIVRNNFHACSVSMPHKETVLHYVDSLDDSAEKIGAVNTIVNKNGSLIGYNTDFYGAKQVLGNIENKEVVLLGAGGVAKAIAHAVTALQGNLTILNRTEKKANALAKQCGAQMKSWKDLKETNGDILINATSKGMSSDDELILPVETITKFDTIMDVIIPPTKLKEEAKKANKIIISGIEMTTHQAAKQFQIYTGKDLPEPFLNQFIKNN